MERGTGHPAQTARIHEDVRVPCLPCRKAPDRNHQLHQAFRFVLPLVQQRRDRAAMTPQPQAIVCDDQIGQCHQL